ncbi:MAG: hypothetical protein ACI8UO_004271 [Verrucomicrobiales bacterium]|jgi:hypothetical protein
MILRSTIVILAHAATALAAEDFDATIRPILAEHCFVCHGPEKQKGNFRLDILSTDLINDVRAAEHWHDVRSALNLGEMPPDSRDPLPQEKRQQLLGWLNATIEHAEKAQKSKGGRVVVRRLNKTEYQNTMRDLFDLDIDYVRDFPPEGMSEDGFRNNGSALQISGIQLEYYLAAARMALDKAITTATEPQVFEHEMAKSAGGRYPGGRESANRVGRGRAFVAQMKKDYPEEGEFVVRVRARSELPEQKRKGPVARMRVKVGYRPDTVMELKTLAEIDVANEESRTFEFRGRIENFPLSARGQSKFPGLLVWIENGYDEFAEPKKKEVVDEKGKKRKVFVHDPDYPYLEVESVDFKGPVFDAWPPRQHRRILHDSPLRETDETAYASEVVTNFLSRAWRRPASEAEVARYADFFASVRPEFPDFEETIRETLAMALVSPKFLYLLEPADEEPRPLDAFELASRLSYFLWSTMPDAELSAAAESDDLLKPEVLALQVDRLLDDERAWGFIDQFTTQWLALDGMDKLEIDKSIYPDFRDEMKDHMRQETLHFVAALFRNDLSASHLLKSDFTILNENLAKHYGIEGVHGGDFRRVDLAENQRRSGVLNHGSILLGTSTGADSNLIKRAVFIRERLLHDPPAPPPPNVPELKTADPEFAKLPIREQLAIHREDPACADCHANIDPWGQALEAWDAVGLFREEISRQLPKKKTLTLPVDDSGVLPGGHEVSGLDGLTAYLLEHRKEQFADALVRKLMTYALGRTLEFSDGPELDRLTEEFVANDMRMRQLVHSIATSETFRTK